MACIKLLYVLLCVLGFYSHYVYSTSWVLARSNCTSTLRYTVSNVFTELIEFFIVQDGSGDGSSPNLILYDGESYHDESNRLYWKARTVEVSNQADLVEVREKSNQTLGRITSYSIPKYQYANQWHSVGAIWTMWEIDDARQIIPKLTGDIVTQQFTRIGNPYRPTERISFLATNDHRRPFPNSLVQAVALRKWTQFPQNYKWHIQVEDVGPLQDSFVMFVFLVVAQFFDI